MSPEDFSSLQAESPGVKRAALAVEEWRKKHPGKGLLDPTRIAREVTGANLTELVLLLTLAAARGMLTKRYLVRPPTTHTLLEKEYTDPSEIPEHLEDAEARPFNRDDAEVVPVYREVAG